MKKIKVAFIGTGYIGEEHIKVFKNIRSIDIVGIRNRVIKKSKNISKKHNIKFYAKSISELFEISKPDLVVIAVPELSLKKVCEEAFNYNATFLIEKPVGYNLEEAILIERMAKKKKKLAYVGLNRRHYQSTLDALKDIKKIKSKRIVNVLDQQSILGALKCGQPRLVANNFMYANSIHLIDYFCFFCRGKIKKIQKLIDWKKTKKKFVLTKIHFSSGDIGIYQAIWDGPGPWGITITTNEKRWEMKPLEVLTVQEKNSRKSLIKKHKNNLDKKFKPGLMVQAKELIKSFQNKKNTLPTLSDGIRTMRLIKKIYG